MPPIEADLDGDGTKETVTFDGVAVAVGGARLVVDEGDCGDDWQPDPQIPITLRIVDVDRGDKRREVLFRARMHDDEDPPTVSTLIAWDHGNLVRLAEIVDDEPLQLRGDGRVVAQQTLGQACAGGEPEDGHALSRYERVFRYDAARTTLVESRGKRLGKADCSLVVACPYVYVVDPSGAATFAGEILRNVRGASAATLQDLALTVSPDARVGNLVHIRLAETKPETTFLDGVYLSANGRAIAPQRCATPSQSPIAAACAVDGQPLVMHEGDTLELVFDLGDAPADAQLTLWATGYYLPNSWR